MTTATCSGSHASEATARAQMVDTERVITEVQRRPVLWNMENEQYKDREARQKAWREICAALFEHFEELGDKEKEDTVKKIQARWKTARDCYKKTRAIKKNEKSVTAAKKGKVYSYYNMMTFLERNSNNESRRSLTQTEDETSDVGVLTGSSSQSTETVTPSTSKRARKSNSPTPFEKEILKSVNQSRLDDNDDDMAFFKSVMPTLKTFNTCQKLIFRTKIMEHLIEVEKQNVSTKSRPTARRSMRGARSPALKCLEIREAR